MSNWLLSPCTYDPKETLGWIPVTVVWEIEHFLTATIEISVSLHTFFQRDGGWLPGSTKTMQVYFGTKIASSRPPDFVCFPHPHSKVHRTIHFPALNRLEDQPFHDTLYNIYLGTSQNSLKQGFLIPRCHHQICHNRLTVTSKLQAIIYLSGRSQFINGYQAPPLSQSVIYSYLDTPRFHENFPWPIYPNLFLTLSVPCLLTLKLYFPVILPELRNLFEASMILSIYRVSYDGR